MGDQPKSSFSLMPPVAKRTSITSVNSSQYDSKEKKISLTNSSSSISDTASDVPNAKPNLRYAEIDSIQVSEYESDQIRDSDDQANAVRPANLKTHALVKNLIQEHRSFTWTPFEIYLKRARLRHKTVFRCLKTAECVRSVRLCLVRDVIRLLHQTVHREKIVRAVFNWPTIHALSLLW